MSAAAEFSFTPELKAKFDEDGYLVIPNFFTAEKAQELKERSDKLLNEFDLAGHPMTQFSTGERFQTNKHVGDDYFLTSGDKIRFFFEEAAFDENGALNRDKSKAVNKIGHGLHMHDQVFRDFTLDKRVQAIARALNFEKPVVLQSMVILKQPYIGGKVPSHQDSEFLYTDPPTARGFWFALEDCTPSNGTLSFIPGSHKNVPLRRRFVRDAENGGTKFIGEVQSLEFPDDQFVTESVGRGSLVLLHGSVVHKSTPNLSANSRYIYTFHVIDMKAKYADDNWLQPSGVPFTPLY
ncbi:phytanoyl-CoA dioxygenase [Basidiobolus meristosporus CBS 931.73]|uniref:Phytanoyl-CoA dioxygenase n=1 Tax=Basidiobolus meristosporus CBS 931.73 TaxID=1314790 RepID=A0A1Y1XW69_9FUNG|nr:phytanoyl-CoA dioxygenase [Basidiobolus meristosporus CBS 931.73]|eukprot:ORX90000.1 phytanoyl-CoA dioxygenase [Basidiobolus meristosporus CBS 931.73]